MANITIKTGIWYEDRDLSLNIPDDWVVDVYWPSTPEPLDADQIEERLDAPIGCDRIQDQARGKETVAIIVDDLSRPTPVHGVLAFVLRRLEEGGISRDAISIVVATGTHGRQDSVALRNKLGRDVLSGLVVEVHDDLHNVKRIGKTSFATPVYVNRNVLNADLVLGIGGVYPQHTTGFGGGGKLALGVCGRQTIMGLHYKHESMQGRYITSNDFRRDVSEIAQLIGLNTILNVHIDAFSNIVNVVLGNPSDYYDAAAAFSHDRYVAPATTDADVVIANAYPLDTSFTFMRKGYKPLYVAPKDCVKIMIVGAHEGIGVHGLYQHINPSKLSQLRNFYLRALSMEKKELLQKIARRLLRMFKRTVAEKETNTKEGEKITALPPNSRHLYVWRTDRSGEPIPEIDDVSVFDDWDQLVAAVSREHFGARRSVRAVLYPCAPIQCIDD